MLTSHLSPILASLMLGLTSPNVPFVYSAEVAPAVAVFFSAVVSLSTFLLLQRFFLMYFGDPAVGIQLSDYRFSDPGKKLSQPSSGIYT